MKTDDKTKEEPIKENDTFEIDCIIACVILVFDIQGCAYSEGYGCTEKNHCTIY